MLAHAQNVCAYVRVSTCAGEHTLGGCKVREVGGCWDRDIDIHIIVCVRAHVCISYVAWYSTLVQIASSS